MMMVKMMKTDVGLYDSYPPVETIAGMLQNL